MKHRLPFVLLNLAMTADGKIATANRAASSFGSREDQRHMFELRATVDAIMSGARTVDLNPVTLGLAAGSSRRLRLKRKPGQSPLRVIVSGSGTLNPEAEIFRHRFSPIIVLTTARASRPRLARLRTLADDVHLSGHGEIDFVEALGWLRKKWGVRRLLCEGGGELNDGLFRAGLVNELNLTVCPLIFGGRNSPTICDGIGAKTLAAATPLKLKSARRVGAELFLVYRVARPPG